MANEKKPKEFDAFTIHGNPVKYRRGPGPGQAIQRLKHDAKAWSNVDETDYLAAFSVSELRAICDAWKAES